MTKRKAADLENMAERDKPHKLSTTTALALGDGGAWARGQYILGDIVLALSPFFGLLETGMKDN